jgi:predicted NAD/FAD-binding protein
VASRKRHNPLKPPPYAPVTKISRQDGKVNVTWVDGQSHERSEEFTSVIIATPADVAKRILDTEWWESWALSQVRYTPVIVDLHSDTSVLPEPGMRRAFHYIQRNDDPLSFELIGRMTEMFRYGDLNPEPIITLNPQHHSADRRREKPIVSRVWRHHTQDLWHIATMDVLLTQMQGRGNVYYAGDWVKFIGHGQAMRTGMNAACKISGVKNEVELKANPHAIPCRDVTVIDARTRDERDKKIRMCSVEDAYRYITAMACPEYYPESQRIEP